LLYTWEEQAPIGERIIELMDENGNLIEDSQIFKVTMNEFLAEGGDGFSIFQEGTMIQEGPSELDVLTQYIQGYEDILVPALNRIHVN
jgi:5'-nucleotidase